jgi:hypothetical protein
MVEVEYNQRNQYRVEVFVAIKRAAPELAHAQA